MNNFLTSLKKTIVPLKRAKLYALLHILLVGVTIGLLTIVASLLQSLYMNKSDALSDPNLTVLNARFGVNNDYNYGNSPLFAKAVLSKDSKNFIVEKRTNAKVRVNGLRHHMQGNLVSAAFFDTFQPPMLLGRLFTQDEYKDFSSNKVIISANLADRLGVKQQKDLIGLALEIDDVKHLIVGVIDSTYKSPKELIGEENDIWLPLDTLENLNGRWSSFSSNLNIYCHCDKVSKNVLAEIKQLLINNSGSELPPEFKLELQNRFLSDTLYADSKRLTLIVSLNIALLCLFSIAIIVNITVIRTLSSTQIFAIHTVLGASTKDLINKVLFESLLLSVAGLILGCLAAQYLISALEYMFGAKVPQLSLLTIDLSYLIFSFIIFLVIFGTIAVFVTFIIKRQQLIKILRGSGKGQTKTSLGRLKSFILGMQVLICFLALSTNFNFMYESSAIVLKDRGLNENAGYLQVELPAHTIMGEGKSHYFRYLRDNYFTKERFAKFSFVDYPPIFNGAALHDIKSIDGSYIAQMQVNGVDSEYFEILGLKLLSGRIFTDEDIKQQKLFAVINNNALNNFKGVAIGHSIYYEGNAYEVIGVVSDINNPVINIPGSEFTVYVPFKTQDYVPTLNAVFLENNTVSNGAVTLKKALENHDKDLFLDTYESISASIHLLLQDYKITSYTSVATTLLLVVLIFSSFYNSINYFLLKQLSDIVVRMRLGMRTSQLMLYLGRQIAFVTIVATILGVFLALLIYDNIFNGPLIDPKSIISILAAGVIVALAFFLSICRFVRLCQNPSIYAQERNPS